MSGFGRESLAYPVPRILHDPRSLALSQLGCDRNVKLSNVGGQYAEHRLSGAKRVGGVGFSENEQTGGNGVEEVTGKREDTLAYEVRFIVACKLGGSPMEQPDLSTQALLAIL